MDDHYFLTFADEKEIELFAKEDAKGLYKYAIENDKPWTIFANEDSDMDDIMEAMDLMSRI